MSALPTRVEKEAGRTLTPLEIYEVVYATAGLDVVGLVDVRGHVTLGGQRVSMAMAGASSRLRNP